MSCIPGGGWESIRNLADSKLLQLQELEQDEHDRGGGRELRQGADLRERGRPEHDPQSSQHDKIAADPKHIGVVGVILQHKFQSHL